MEKVNDIKSAIRAEWGENRPVNGVFDPALGARCDNGTFVGREKEGVLTFKGIPFACPPTGELRWKKPVRAPENSGVYEAFYNGKTPIQTEWETERASYYVQGEDCLYLNVWTGSDRTVEGKAVMVFFHGGSYGWGGTADPLYDGFRFALAHPDVVLITAGYRVGLMGFVDFSSVRGGESFPDAPNLGLWDQIEALRWVKRNASAFGGDPECVTIFGESAGGGSVSLLPMIPEASGLFRRVIAQSGSVALTYSKDECRPFTERLLKESGAACMDDLLRLTEEQLIKLNRKLNAYNNFPQRDGILIPEDPYEPYREGRTSGFDMMMGTNADEANYWVNEVGGIIPYRFGTPIMFENHLKKLSREDKKRVKSFMQLKEGYSLWRISAFFTEIMFRLPAVRQAEEHKRNGGRCYMYFWEEQSEHRFLRACHAVELAYVFGNTEDTIYTGKPADPGLSKTVQDMWVRFAKTGDPGTAELPWPEYDSEDRWTMMLSLEPHAEEDPLPEEREILEPILDYRINGSYADMSLNVPFVWKSLAKVLGILLLIAGIVVLAVID
ncbi:MAG: carboxylesterase/lipase family protein [Clostridia bacterium]|nr:carboxylesterase/lipase family protein [Clostridia bacterium]